MDDDWGLNAIVRGCSAATSSATSAPPPPPPPPLRTAAATGSLAADFSPFGQPTATTTTSFMFSSSYGHAGQFFSLSSPSSSSSDLVSSSSARSFGHGSAVEDLHELYKPFFPKSETAKNAIQTVKSRASDVVLSSPKHSVTTPRSKKRKNQVKKVCQVPAESLSSDIWAWRKYGQKPIKGSPYPRGYYRCSSSKGCLARKQVERNRSDPGMFIVTYTAEHNHPAPTHRNSLAGSTRQKPSLSSDPSKPSEPTKLTSPATSPENDSPVPAQAISGSATESKEGPESSTMLMEDDEDDEEFGFSDVAVSDEFFVGLEGLGSPTSGEFLSDNFLASFGLPWPASSAATAAGGR